jgi:hypothetical protein
LGFAASPVWAQNQPAGPAAEPKQPEVKQPEVKQPAAPPPASPPVARRSYTPLPVDAEQRKHRTSVQGLLRRGAVAPEQRAPFEKYYKSYALARWTDPPGLAKLENKDNFNLPDCRREFRNELYLARGKPAHDELIALALPFFERLAKDARRYPVSRINAMLAIGELNAVEAGTGGANPEPWPDALPILVREYNNASQLDAVRVAALLGILRHAQLEIDDPQARSQINSDMLKLAQTKEDPRRSAEGQVMVRARAMEVLGALKDPGPQNAVAKALAAIVADQSDNLIARRAAAQALGRLDLSGAQGLDGAQMSVALAQLAADACAAELERMEKEAEQKPRSTRGPMGMMMGGPMMEEMEYDMMYEDDSDEGAMYSGGYEEPYGMGPGSPYGQRKEEEQDDTLNNRRRLKTFLNASLLGLSGLTYLEWPDWVRANADNADALPTKGTASVTAPAQGGFVKGLITQVDTLSKVCDNKEELTREDFTAELEKQLGILTEALGAAAGPAPSSEPPEGAAETPATLTPAPAGIP